MTDIIELLRASNARMGTRDPNDYSVTITVAEANQAADEIERLRLIINTIHPQMQARIERCEAEIEAVQNTPLGAVVAKWQEEWRNMQAQRDEALAKVTELREALQWFVDNDDTNEGDEPMPEYDGQTWNEINAYWIDGLNRARAALQG